jgi:Nitroreductase family
MNEPMTAEEVVRYLVSRAVWAPSVHNTQPWRFTADDGPRVSLHADVGRRLAVADPDGREMMISCGAALFNIRLALRSLDWIPQTRVLPDPAQPTLIAQVAWQERADADEFERRLSGHVLTRRTHRGAFDPEPLPPDTLAALRDAAAREGAALRIVADDGRRATLAAAVQTAEHQLRRDGERLRELARWTPAPGSARYDRVPATSYPARAERTQPYFSGRDFARGHGWGVPPLSPATSHRAAGVAGLLTTTGDSPADWVHAGQALQRILLTASACGAAVALHSQPLELPWLREFLRTQLSDAACPHLVLRIGMVTQVAVSVRRDPRDEDGEVGAGELACPPGNVGQHLAGLGAGQQPGGNLRAGLDPALLAAGRVIQPGVLHCDVGRGAQGDQHRLVVLGELTPPRLPVRYKLPKTSSRTRTGTPRKPRIGGCPSGKPDDAGCEEMSASRSGRGSSMSRPSRPRPSGQWWIPAISSWLSPTGMNSASRRFPPSSSPITPSAP